MELLTISNATLFRGSNKVFENFSLAISEGENTAIVGPNGAGKSTLMKVVSREIYPSSGSVSILGRTQWNVWELRKQLGLISNDLQQFFKSDTIGRDVILSGFFSSQGIYEHQPPDDYQRFQAAEISTKLDINALRDVPFSRMSTGEQRRHLLARALVHQPDALILDEPTAGLDIPATFQYLRNIRSLIAAGKTIVLVTHHVDEIPPEVGRVILIKDGKIQNDGPKADVLTDSNLTRLFEFPVRIIESGGYFRVMPHDQNASVNSTTE